ncbi:ribonuclease H-like domain-containing protein [Aspergillus taichungensis]|uniref:Ribonuclease H-like domain-containing protein n=1 Tax=Aspergillus taichungensis TaxID=482145 RepID=A0A2J5HHU5_9EURO|nr:ribonuclease H-like domain-containing protein [Aspergillus taichungensis]
MPPKMLFGKPRVPSALGRVKVSYGPLSIHLQSYAWTPRSRIQTLGQWTNSRISEPRQLRAFASTTQSTIELIETPKRRRQPTPSLAGNKRQPSGVRNLVAEQRPSSSPPKFWSHNQYKGSDGKNITVHYCRTLKSTEEVARYFLDDKVLGLDLEWKAQASASDSIQNNMSLIQIANKERIALFHLALFQPAKSIDDLVAPSLRRIIQSPEITKVGVSIKADCTRLRKFLGINARGIFELSHLYKLVKYCHTNPALINKRLVNLSDQVLEHFGLPLQKDDDVRCGDWTYPLNYRQVQCKFRTAMSWKKGRHTDEKTPLIDAASDPYACLCLFYTMDAKRQALDPTPPLPAHAELDLPIRIVHETPVQTEPEDVEVIDPAENQANPTK